MAGTSRVNVRIIGVDDLQRKLTPAIAGRPVRRFLERGTILIFNTAVREAPVGVSGRLKGSHARLIDPSTLPLWGQTGVKVDYAEDVHFGTPPHYVPPPELDEWARKKKIKGGGEAVSDWIAARGTKANPWLYDSLASNENAIKALVPVLAKEIEDAYANG